MEDDAGAARRARLAAIRAAAEAEAAAGGAEPEEPAEREEATVVKFRSYVPRHADELTFERVRREAEQGDGGGGRRRVTSGESWGRGHAGFRRKVTGGRREGG